MVKRDKIGRFVGSRGKHAANWKGGRIKRAGGYWYLHFPEHPFAIKQGYVAEHRLVMEQLLGRYLKNGEIVHHKNGNITDNRPKNLELFSSHGEHTANGHPEIAEKQKITFKGKHFSPKTEFKKGNVPWNKKSL